MNRIVYFTVIALFLGGVLNGCAAPSAPPVANAITVSTLHADYSWVGWGSRGYTMNVNCTDGTCTAAATCLNGLGETAQEVNLGSIPLEANALTNISGALGNLRRVDATEEVIEHTDDYPTYTITLTADNGQEIVVTSTSNTKNNTPWNFRVEERLYVQEGTAFPTAYFALLNQVKPNACW